MTPGIDRVLDDLIYGRWVLTIEGEPPHDEYVAYRPPGWDGPDPDARIAAPTRQELLHALANRSPRDDLTEDERRHQQVQDRLTRERQEEEKRTGRRVDLIGDGDTAHG